MIRTVPAPQSQQLHRLFHNYLLFSRSAVISSLITAIWICLDIKVSFRQRISPRKPLHLSIDRYVDPISCIRQKLYCHISCHIAAIKALSGFFYHILHLRFLIGRPKFHVSSGYAIGSAHFIAIFLVNDCAVFLRRHNTFIFPNCFGEAIAVKYSTIE